MPGVWNDAISIVLFHVLVSSRHRLGDLNNGDNGDLATLATTLFFAVANEVFFSLIIGVCCGLANARIIKTLSMIHSHPIHQVSPSQISQSNLPVKYPIPVKYSGPIDQLNIPNKYPHQMSNDLLVISTIDTTHRRCWCCCLRISPMLSLKPRMCQVSSPYSSVRSRRAIMRGTI